MKKAQNDEIDEGFYQDSHFLTIAQFVQFEIGIILDETVRVLGAPQAIRLCSPRYYAEVSSDFAWHRWSNTQTQIALLFKKGARDVKEQKELL